MLTLCFSSTSVILFWNRFSLFKLVLERVIDSQDITCSDKLFHHFIAVGRKV